jgi:translation initiation factor 1 (eIF-1/SUI1)
MIIQIKTDESLDPRKSVVIINGVEYKNIKNLQLRLAKDANGELTVQHDSGYLEAYKAEVINDL